MTELPRSRALMRMDGPGHIMPVEPITPPDSSAWRFVHFPVMLGLVAAGLLLAAVLAIDLLGLVLQFFTYIPGGRYLVPLIGLAAVITVYWVFVRIIERRPAIDELGASGWLKEFGLGLCGGLALALATFALQGVLGDVRIFGFNPPQVMLLPIVVQICTAAILEIVLRGIAFRQGERLLGSWLSLAASVIAFGVAALVSGHAEPFSMLAYVLHPGLVCTALYMVTRRLWAAIGLHAAWNLGLIALDGVATSDSGPHGLVLSRVVGPDWLTGAGANAETSAPALAVNALLTIVLLAIAVRRGRIVRPLWLRGRSA